MLTLIYELFHANTFHITDHETIKMKKIVSYNAFYKAQGLGTLNLTFDDGSTMSKQYNVQDFTVLLAMLSTNSAYFNVPANEFVVAHERVA
ncbi:hypothetical protein BXP70_28990 [Hymenobacter crusticola]|uniref:Uncharacterized protein n=1 Tax=Hymenobacter crusticola TaxID=1770526 RepID=A0A243W774_9BACT|nr:hypothetical protein BXP70_28990 [Hymenobacter crusticola]